MVHGVPPFVVLETRDTRYSIRAIVAAVESKLGVRVDVVDSLEKLVKRGCELARKHGLAVAGVSLLTVHVVESLNGIAEAVRALRSCRAVTVAGGAHATGDPYGTVKVLGFDVAVVGEGEETVNELLRTLGDEGFEGLESVRGLVVSFGDDVVFTGRREPVNLDDYPPFPYWRGMFAPIEITRACPWGCRYCETWYIHGGAHRHRSVERIRFYAEVMAERGLRDLRFITPNALAYGEAERGRPNLAAVEELLDSLKQVASRYPGTRIFFGTFPSEIRPDYVTRDAMKLLAKTVSNNSVIIGAQSGSDRILKLLNRGHGVTEVVEAVEAANDAGFSVDVDLILGIPYETEEDMEQTLSFAKMLVARYRVRLHLHTFIPLPGTPMESLAAKPLPPRIEREYHRLVGAGKAYGYWLKQASLSKAINELYRRGVIYGLRGWRFIRIRRA